jgi:Uncharacterized protein conserved in bacteria
MEIAPRKIWLDAMLKIAEPVLTKLSERKLKESMPLEFHSGTSSFAPLEAFARLICGMAPWIECENLSTEEEVLRQKYEKLILVGIDAATDTNSPDYMNFGSCGKQPLVDTAFLAHALVRAPKHLIDNMEERVKTNLVKSLKRSRSITASGNNWLFFTAMVESALYLLGEEDYDKMRIEYAVHMFMEWYKGDGVYGDGKDFHWDYYNSFVIHPMFVDIMKLFENNSHEYQIMKPIIIKRATRYSSILERLIAPDGTYPIIGRSITYRFGAFQLLSQAALEHFLDENIKPAQVRCALTAMIEKVMETPRMFDANGWLQPGVYGLQPELAESYINIGSLYLCTTVFLPLGLHPKDEFWSAPEEAWTSKKIWSGEHAIIDHAISE